MSNHALPVMIVLMLSAAGGCIEQQLTLTSQPAGALVYVSDVEVGRTPVTIPFTYTGDYDIVLRKEGCQTLKTHANLKPTAYEVPPLDFFATLWPTTFRDQRYLHFSLLPATQPSDETLIKNAQEMRQENLQPTTGPSTR